MDTVYLHGLKVRTSEQNGTGGQVGIGSRCAPELLHAVLSAEKIISVQALRVARWTVRPSVGLFVCLQYLRKTNTTAADKVRHYTQSYVVTAARARMQTSIAFRRQRINLGGTSR